jgi:hypothetical protein
MNLNSTFQHLAHKHFAASVIEGFVAFGVPSDALLKEPLLHQVRQLILTATGILILSLGLVAQPPALAKHLSENTPNRLQKNPASWFRFGEGIFTTCNSMTLVGIDIYDAKKTHRCDLKRGSKKFDLALQWVQENCAERLNSIPPNSNYENELLAQSFMLYCSSEIPKNTTEAEKSLIITIPVSGLVFGTSFDYDFKKLVKEISEN